MKKLLMVFGLGLAVSFGAQADDAKEMKKCIELIKMYSASKYVVDTCSKGSGESERLNSIYLQSGCDKIIDSGTGRNIAIGVSFDMEGKRRELGEKGFCDLAFSNEEQPKQVAPQQVEPQVENAKQGESVKSWQGDWGSGIVATVSSEPCANPRLVEQGYTSMMTVSIPKERLKNTADAWNVAGDRAITILGCWSAKPDSMIHAKLTRKKGDKTWEQDFKMTDGNWTAK